MTLLVYSQVRNHEFISYDDEVYVTKNPHVLIGITAENIIRAFTYLVQFNGNWHPVTWLSHMTDVQLYGMNAGAHHITSVVIHTASSAILLLLLFRLTGALWQSAFVAAMFALHPMHVESVAWVAERKDVLSAFFGLLTLLFYSEFVAKRKSAMYILALVSYVLGLMSKSMLVTLPFVMLLIDYWPLDRYRLGKEYSLRQITSSALALVKEKITFFACSLSICFLTIYTQSAAITALPLRLRIENVLIAYVRYIGKALWPTDLAVLYPLHYPFTPWKVAGSTIVLLLFSVTAIRVRRRYPYVAVGWFWFLITLIPVIGLIQVGFQSIADRYSYIPLIGFFIVIAWGSADLTNGLKYRKAILALLGWAVVLISAALTWQQLGYWRDSISLYQHTIRVTTGNYTIHYNLGKALAEKGDQSGAIKQFQEGLKSKPNNIRMRGSLGIALAENGDLEAAIREFQYALRINPNDPKMQKNLEVAFTRKRMREEVLKY